MAEREEISRGVAAGEPCRQIAARLGRAPSTVSRELARNGGRHRYRAQAADAAAFGRAQRPKAAKLVMQPRLREVVEAKLALRWSPQQVAGWLPLAYPQDPVMRVSHETNGLLRQYLSKSIDLRRFDQAALDAIAAELNGRPRQTLGFRTPSQALAEALR